MNLSTHTVRPILAAAALLTSVSAASAQFSIRWSTLDGGGAAVAAGAYRLQGTLGQADAVAPRSAPDGTMVTGGYWAAPPPACIGDLNADGLVNTSDLVRFLGAFGTSVPAGTSADFNADGAVNTSDLVIFLARFGQPCP